MEFQAGKKAVLTIYHDGEEQEQVELQTIPTADEMHALMLEKGFKMKSEEEVAEVKKKADELMKEELEAQRQRKERAQKIALERQKKHENGGDAEKDKAREQARDLLKNKNIKLDDVKSSSIDIDALPEEDEISKEQMKELKRRQWEASREKRKAAGVGDEL